MTTRAISVAALAVGLVIVLVACSPSRVPSTPAASRVSPSYAPQTRTAAPGYSAPPYAAPPHAAQPYAAPSRLAPNQYSGSSMPPQTGRSAGRYGRHRPNGRSHRWVDLDETQLQAQWINPPNGAGE